MLPQLIYYVVSFHPVVDDVRRLKLISFLIQTELCRTSSFSRFEDQQSQRYLTLSVDILSFGLQSQVLKIADFFDFAILQIAILQMRGILHHS